MIALIGKEDCTGCGACVNICPRRCITMSEDYPVINHKSCISCRLCQKVCPAQTGIDLFVPQKCYAAFRNDTNCRKNSASGGVAASISEFGIVSGYHVYGVSFDANHSPYFRSGDTFEEIEAFKGSKYVQAYTGDIYIQIYQALTKKERCIFFGTPCQVAALRKYIELREPQYLDNLVLVDLLCHGVTPNSHFIDEIQYLKRKKGVTNISKISFRNNNDRTAFKLELFDGEKKVYRKSAYCQPYYYGFLRGISLRKNCFHCKYAKSERVGDISIGDFIGLGSNARYRPFMEDTHNVSIVLENTRKGRNIINEISKQVKFRERKIEEALEGCTALRESFSEPMSAKLYQEYIKVMDPAEAIRKITKKPILINSLLRYMNFVLRKAHMKTFKLR